MRDPSGLRRIAALAAAALLAAACAPAAPTGPTPAPAKPAATTAPAKPAESKPAAQPTAAAKPEANPAASPAAAKPAASPAAKTAEKPAAKPAAKAAAQPSFNEQAVADFYRGKTVRIVVGFNAGGGYDTYSRLISRHISDYIPGNPTVIVENMPGAGSIVAANQVYNALPKDGTVIGNISGPIVLEQLFQTEGVQFDMARFQYLNVPVPETYLVLVKKETGVTRFEQIVGPNAQQIIMGTIPGSTVEHGPVLLRDALGANIQVVSGYTGTSQVRLAMDRGEVDGFTNTWQSTKVTNLEDVQSGNWVILAQLGSTPIPELPQQNVPTIPQIAQTDEQRQLLLFGTSYPNQFGKVYVVAPEVPTDRAAALEAAFAQTMRDPEFLAEAQQGNLDIDPLGSAEIRPLLQEMLGMSESIENQLKQVMKGTGS